MLFQRVNVKIDPISYKYRSIKTNPKTTLFVMICLDKRKMADYSIQTNENADHRALPVDCDWLTAACMHASALEGLLWRSGSSLAHT